VSAVAWATRTRIAQACIGKRLGRKNRKLERDWYVYVHTHVCTRYMGACKRLDNSGHDGSAAPNGVMEAGRRTCIRVHTHNTYTHTHTSHAEHTQARIRACILVRYRFRAQTPTHCYTHTHTTHTIHEHAPSVHIGSVLVRDSHAYTLTYDTHTHAQALEFAQTLTGTLIRTH